MSGYGVMCWNPPRTPPSLSSWIKLSLKQVSGQIWLKQSTPLGQILIPAILTHAIPNTFSNDITSSSHHPCTHSSSGNCQLNHRGMGSGIIDVRISNLTGISPTTCNYGIRITRTGTGTTAGPTALGNLNGRKV